MYMHINVTGYEVDCSSHFLSEKLFLESITRKKFKFSKDLSQDHKSCFSEAAKPK